MRRLVSLLAIMGVVVLLGGVLMACAVGSSGQQEPEPTETTSLNVMPLGGESTEQQETEPRTVVSAAVEPMGGECVAQIVGRSLVTDQSVYPVPDLVEPEARHWFTDPVFGSCVVRVTNRETDLGAGDESKGMVNEYARVQAFNADGSRLLAYSTDGWWYLYDVATLEPLGELPLGVEPRWDAVDPALIYYNDETRLMSYDVASGTKAEIHDFAADFPGWELASQGLASQGLGAVWTKFEGRPSRDGRYWGLMAEDEDWLPVAFVVYDRETDAVALRDMRGVPGVEDDVDHVTISPLGNNYLASFDRACEEGQLGDDGHPCGLMVYDRDLAEGRGLLRVIGHYDTALDSEGREVVVYQDIDTDHISMLDLESGTVTPLWEIDYTYTGIGLHFSGLAYDRPGWVVVSTHDDDAESYTWMDDQVFAVELKAGGRVARLAHTHSLVDDDLEADYWAEPHASTNPDLTRIVFGTNWGRSGSGEVEMFMIALPSDWTEWLALP